MPVGCEPKAISPLATPAVKVGGLPYTDEFVIEVPTTAVKLIAVGHRSKAPMLGRGLRRLPLISVSRNLARTSFPRLRSRVNSRRYHPPEGREKRQ